MLSPELRELTASEPLTAEEEHQMQVKWQTDDDKLTFIILARPHLLSRATFDGNENILPSPKEILTFRMIGDVNLFLKESPEGCQEVEAEVMVAEPAYRRKGVAFNALQILFHYATSPEGPPSLRIPTERLIARIGQANSASLRLFEKLSFRVTRQVPVFQEVELRYMGDGQWTPGKCIAID
ncbi:GNAT domain-containing protein [Gautieria morchelliformis]|nr:GNAT domain-containing protein [Gautieria morchelliformis]